MTFTINFPPTGKARPRVTRTHTYTPQKTVDYENLVKWSYIAAKGKMHIGAVRVTIKTYFAPPKSASKATRQLMLTKERFYTHKCDVDNLAKAVLDALNGVAYKDDAQVSILSITKVYGAIPRTQVEILELEGENSP